MDFINFNFLQDNQDNSTNKIISTNLSLFSFKMIRLNLMTRNIYIPKIGDLVDIKR